MTVAGNSEYCFAMVPPVLGMGVSVGVSLVGLSPSEVEAPPHETAINIARATRKGIAASLSMAPL